MLFIQEKGKAEIGWHVGEPVPSLGRVVTFQADGDELDMIVDRMGGRKIKYLVEMKEEMLRIRLATIKLTKINIETIAIALKNGKEIPKEVLIECLEDHARNLGSVLEGMK